MNKTIKIILIGIVSIVIILAGIQFFAMLLMEDEDHHIGIEFLSPQLQDGDLIFQTSQSSQSKAIQLATKSKFSHMGMIYIKDNKTRQRASSSEGPIYNMDPGAGEWNDREVKRRGQTEHQEL